MIRKYDKNKVKISDINELAALVNQLKESDDDLSQLAIIKHKLDGLILDINNNSEGVERKPITVAVDMGDCRIEFYNYEGNQAKTGDLVRSWMWALISDKVDPKCVKSVTIPTLRYDSLDSLKIMVEIEPTL